MLLKNFLIILIPVVQYLLKKRGFTLPILNHFLAFIGSPFKPVISDKVDPNKVIATGPGLDTKNGVRHNVPTQFHVDATQAGKAPLDVTIIPERG